MNNALRAVLAASLATSLVGPTTALAQTQTPAVAPARPAVAPARPAVAPARPAVPPTPAAPQTEPAPATPPAPATEPAPATQVAPAPPTGPTLPPPPPADQPAAAVQPQTPPQAQPSGPRMAVVDAAPIGVDPAAAQYVTHVIRTSVTELGFAPVPTQELYDAARRIQLPFPVPVDGMVALERVLQAPVGITAEVRAAGGQYVVRLRVRVAVEGAERTREVSASQFQLTDALRAALPPLLVPPNPDAVATPGPATPEVRNPEGPDALGQGAPGLGTPGLGAPGLGAAGAGEGGDIGQPVVRRRRVRAHPRAWELGGGVIVAFGPGRDSFINALVPVRLSWFPSDRVGLSATVAYANLNGRNGRVSNVLMALGVETSVDLVPSSRVFIPLRAEIGYLPSNGPVFRLTAGVAFQLARRVRLEIDLLSPTLWILPESSPVSLDLGATVKFGL